MSNTAEKILLRLNDVTAYATVAINGEFAGARLWSPYEFDITDKIRDGQNEIAITVGSTEENAMTESNKNAGIFGKIEIIGVNKR